MKRVVGSSPAGSSPAIPLALLDPRAVADQPVEPASLDVGAELARLADHSLTRAEHQPAVLGHRGHQTLEREGLLVRAEIEQHIAAQDDIEPTRMGRRLEYIVNLEAHRLSQRLDRAPAVAGLLEPFDHLVDAEPALDLELGVAARARTI